jgi:hypothetical protein
VNAPVVVQARGTKRPRPSIKTAVAVKKKSEEEEKKSNLKFTAFDSEEIAGHSQGVTFRSTLVLFKRFYLTDPLYL